jgi:hypothetical protein
VFQLEEPIIALTPDPHVTLTFTIDDPSRVSISPSTLDWATTEWPVPSILAGSLLLAMFRRRRIDDALGAHRD